LNVIPNVSGIPIIGSALELFGDIRAFFTAQYLQHGPVYRVKALHHRFTVLAGLDANVFTIRHGKHHFRSKETWQQQDIVFGARRSLVSMDGADHIYLRKKQKRGYSRGMIELNIPQTIKIAQHEIQQWPVNQSLPGLYSMQKIITEQLGRTIADFSPKEYLDDLVYFIRTVQTTTVTKQRPRFFRYTPRFYRAHRRILAMGQKVIDNHLQYPPEDRPQNLIGDILSLAREDPEFLPASDIMVAILGPFAAGLDTAASATTFVLYALLKHPDLMADVTSEVDSVFGRGELTPSRIKECDLLHRTILETMRMYPTAPALQRTVTKPFEFGDYTIQANEPIIIASTVPHYLAEIYPNPEIFDIDRYTPHRKENRQPGSYAPFGLGPHTCIGAGFAETQIMLTIATLLHQTELALAPKDYHLHIDPIPTPSPDRHFRFKVLRHRH